MRKIYLVLLVSFWAVAVSAQTKVAAVQKQPDFTASNMKGKVITLSELRGKIVVLNLWFINCLDCNAEIKALNELVAQYKDNKDVVFLAPAANRKPELEAFLKKNPFAYQVIPNALMLIIIKFGMPDKEGEINIPFPMHYVIDREGNIVVKVEGTKGIEAVKSELKKQLAAK
jgi:peroxiredoxin